MQQGDGWFEGPSWVVIAMVAHINIGWMFSAVLRYARQRVKTLGPLFYWALIGES